jgi:hypothetical protein
MTQPHALRAALHSMRLEVTFSSSRACAATAPRLRALHRRQPAHALSAANHSRSARGLVERLPERRGVAILGRQRR